MGRRWQRRATSESGLLPVQPSRAHKRASQLPLQFASLLLAFYLVRSVQFRKATRHLECGRVDPALLISWLDGTTAPSPRVEEAVIFEELLPSLPQRTGRDISQYVVSEVPCGLY